MEYNSRVRKIIGLSDAVHLIRFAAVLWLVYLVILTLIINYLFTRRQETNLIYYGLLASIAMFCLGLTYWPWIQRKLGRAFVPILIAIITIMPIVVNHLASRLSPLGSRFGSPEGSSLGMLPFLFVGLLLVAWQYKWHYILLVILGFAGINLGIVWFSTSPGGPPFQGVIVITLIQTVIFLAVGFSISFLMDRLRKQQQSLEAANVRLTNYAGTLEELATSQERTRLARELHDTLAHTLSGLAVQLEAVKAYWDVDRQTARAVLEKSLLSTHSGLEETRRTLRDLRASPLEELGLTAALKKMAEDAAAHAKLQLDLSVSDCIPGLPHNIEQCIYRVAQEAIANAINHAKAKNLAVKLGFNEGKANLSISDDGIGFEPGKVNGTGHLGLTGMRERAQLVGGELTIESKPGTGTTVHLKI